MIKLTSFFPARFMLIVCLAASGRAIGQNNTNKATPSTDSLTAVKEVEYVSVGYSSIPRANLAGSVSIVEEARIKELNGVSITALLQAQAAGVKVVNTSGAPGSGALTIIRGVSTLNAGTAPLYIIDGIPVKSDRFRSLAHNVDNDPLADINPQDISSISILKDGQATSMYGMRGANGVIIINTYGGTSGKTYLDLSSYVGVTQSPKSLPVLDADEYRAYILEKERARGLSPAQINDGIGRYLLLSTPADQVQRYNNNTDWQDDALDNGMYSDFHLNLRGGDAVAKYSLNIGYTDIKGVITETDFQRFSTRFNLDYKVGKKLSFLNTLTYTRTDKQVNDGGDGFNTNPLVLNTLKSPTLTVFQQNLLGEDQRDLDSSDYAGRNNPYAVINGLSNKTNTNRILGRITGQYTFSPHLNLRVAIAGDYYRMDESRYRPSQGFKAEKDAIRSSAAAKSYELMLLNENTLNYSKSFKGRKHILDATVGSAYQNTEQDAKTAVYINAPSDLFSGITSVGNSGGSNPSTDPNIDTVMSFSPGWKLMSFFANAQYTFKEKYILSVNFRADGSSRFARNHRWGYFPGAAAAWQMSKESFLQNSKLISDLKLRASFGISGNQEVGYFNAFNSLISSPYSRFSAIRVGILGNPDFTWESTAQGNIGIDAAFFGDRLNITVDGYRRKTTHLYNTIKLPGISGFDTYAVSEGSVRNYGVELALGGKIMAGNFGWQANFIAAYNKNKILSMPEKILPAVNYGSYSGFQQAGTAIGAFYGYNAIGVYSSTSNVNVKNGVSNVNPFQGGDIIFEDVDNNGIIDERDQKVIGNSNPDFFGGFSNTFSYKGFDLNVFMDFAEGNEVFNAHRALLESMSNYDNQSTSIEARWYNPGDIADIPRVLHGDAVGNTRFSSRWIEDGSYLRFKAITLGYNFPLKGSLKNIFKTARVLVTAQNVHTFSKSGSKYTGFSPEVANISNPIMYGVDNGNMPQLRTFLIGVRLGL
jgi:TonB-linked SusC/RagA family outer membrane protein